MVLPVQLTDRGVFWRSVSVSGIRCAQLFNDRNGRAYIYDQESGPKANETRDKRPIGQILQFLEWKSTKELSA